MKQQPVFLIVGGDLRQLSAAKALCEDGAVFVRGFDLHPVLPEGVRPWTADCLADVLILPLPCSLDGSTVHAPFSSARIPLDTLSGCLAADAAVFGGRVCDPTRAVFSAQGLSVTDYLEREELSVLNAVPTAEGALQLMLEELPTTVFGRRCLITGYGRIAKVLSRMLLALGASVTVAARKPEDLIWAEIAGCKTVTIAKLDAALPDTDLICNTVPALLFAKTQLRRCRPGVLVIDLASRPGGVDFEAAQQLGVHTIHALSLPGKVAPVTAGESIAATIRNILRERGRA